MPNHFWQGFEKRAAEEKLAYDSDHENETHYGVASNRSIRGSGYVHDALLRAAKDPHLTVDVYAEDLGVDGFSSKDPKKFKAGMKRLREIFGPRPDKFSSRIDWMPGAHWRISARKDNPKFQPKDGEKDEWGDSKTVHQKILDHIWRYDL